MRQFAPGAAGLLAPFQTWLDDPLVSEIMVNQPEAIWIEREGQMQQHFISDLNEKRLRRLFQLIATENQQKLDEEHPILSGSIPDGSRIQCVLPPVAKYPTFAIRRQVVRRLSLQDYKQRNYYQQCEFFDKSANTIEQLDEEDQHLCKLYQDNDWDAFIRHAILYKKVIVISGATSSGKTTFINACLQHIPYSERIILLEDTREIEISHPNQVSLLAVKQKVHREIKQTVSMQDLVQASLRLRPDRIILGEIRGAEILDFLNACSTGHEGSITSIHANNPHIAFMRMKQMYRLNNVPAMTDQDIERELNNVVDIIIQLKKNVEGERKVQFIYYKHAHLIKDKKHLKAVGVGYGN